MPTMKSFTILVLYTLLLCLSLFSQANAQDVSGNLGTIQAGGDNPAGPAVPADDDDDNDLWDDDGDDDMWDDDGDDDLWDDDADDDDWSATSAPTPALSDAPSATPTIAQKIFMSYGEGLCVDSAGAQYDALETSGVESAADCQSRCTTLDATYLRGIQYESSTQTCDCLYENDVGFPDNAFSEVGADEGEGAVAGVNSTFASFSCYKYSGGAFSLLGSGGCVDSDSEYYSFATPLNVQGSQTAADCQNGCIAAGTDGLVGLDYDGECYCLYDEDAAPGVASTVTFTLNSGTGEVSGISTFAGIECQAFAMRKFNHALSDAPSSTPTQTPSPTVTSSDAPSSTPTKTPSPTVVASDAPSSTPTKTPSPTAEASDSPSSTPTQASDSPSSTPTQILL